MDYIFTMCYAEWVNARSKIEFDRELRRKILNITGAWNYYYYVRTLNITFINMADVDKDVIIKKLF